MIYKNDISNLKTEIGDKIGQKIIIKGALGRNKFFKEKAIIKQTYQDIFVVESEETDRDISYKYVDVLTKDLEISIFNGTEYCPMFPKMQVNV